MNHGPELTGDRIAQLRDQLPTLASTVYLNAGTLGPMPAPAIEAMRVTLEQEATHRQPSTLWDDLMDAQASAREAAARLGGVSSDQVALAHSTHEGINACLWGLELTPGSTIITTDEEHPGLLTPLRIAVDRRGIAVRTVPFHPDPRELATAVADAIDSSTAAVALSHVSWVSGSVADVALLSDACGDVPLIVDGAQSAGAMPAAVGSHGADAYTVSGQKWPLGPNGSGALLLADPERWQPTFGSFLTTTDPGACSTAPYQPSGRRLEHSQEALLPLRGFAAAASWLLDAVDMPTAHARSRTMNEHARGVLLPVLERLGTTPADLSGSAHLLVTRVHAGTAESIVQQLADAGVSIRNLGPDLIRFSFGFWTTADDVAIARAALERVELSG